VKLQWAARALADLLADFAAREVRRLTVDDYEIR